MKIGSLSIQLSLGSSSPAYAKRIGCRNYHPIALNTSLASVHYWPLMLARDPLESVWPHRYLTQTPKLAGEVKIGPSCCANQTHPPSLDAALIQIMCFSSRRKGTELGLER